MSVIGNTDCGWLLDHCQHAVQTYKVCKVQEKTFSSSSVTSCCSNDDKEVITSHVLEYHSDMFAVESPYMMDSQFRAWVRQMDQELSDRQMKRMLMKKKRRIEDEGSDDSASIYHESVQEILMKAMEQLIHLGHDISHFKPKKSAAQLDNNASARVLASKADQDEYLAELCTKRADSVEDSGSLCLQGPCSMGDQDLVNTLVQHHSNSASVISVSGRKYIIPSCSTFLLSDISNAHLLTSGGCLYDVIVLDPPWENKSVKRKKTYCMMNDLEIEQLPIQALANDNCLVVIWVTNNHHQQNLVTETYFPKWAITPLASWYWLKVTTAGEPVYPLDAPHSKKPYEVLILGRKLSKTQNKTCQPIPDKKVIISIPSSIHSHKPPLNDIIQPFLPANPKCLELFARSLQPNWTSWGNEVIKLQSMDFFKEVS